MTAFLCPISLSSPFNSPISLSSEQYISFKASFLKYLNFSSINSLVFLRFMFSSLFIEMLEFDCSGGDELFVQICVFQLGESREEFQKTVTGMNIVGYLIKQIYSENIFMPNIILNLSILDDKFHTISNIQNKTKFQWKWMLKWLTWKDASRQIHREFRIDWSILSTTCKDRLSASTCL